MSFDFAAVLALAVALSGFIWALDAAYLARRRRASVEGLEADGARDPSRGHPREPVIVEYARSLFPVFLAVLVLRSFVIEPFRIPSGSMIPTLLVGDFILVNKFTYGIRLPILNKKIIGVGAPERGDVTVFRYPENPEVDYIKRVVGLPGDRIVYRDKTIFVNGEEVKQTQLGRYAGEGSSLRMSGAELRTERLGEAEHELLVNELVRTRSRSAGRQYKVPAGHYFMMGDNRDNSNDSRVWGTVPEDHLVGKAFLIWMNLNTENWDFNWGRAGNVIQ